MPVAKQLAGQVFGRLTVIERFRSRNGRVTCLCRWATRKEQAMNTQKASKLGDTVEVPDELI